MSHKLPFDRPEHALESDAGFEEEYEEITSDEVDRVVEALEMLRGTVGSENIRATLEDAISSIFYLVYEEDPSDRQEEAA